MGTYKVWLSNNSDPESPLFRFNRSGQDYVRADGVLVAEGWSDLTNGTLQAPINVDASGQYVTQAPLTAWTGTQIDGSSVITRTCDNWSETAILIGEVGLIDATDSEWSQRVDAQFLR